MKYNFILIIGLIIVISFIFFFSFRTTGNVSNEIQDSSLGNSIKLKVNIPCQGHAGLIIAELKKISGVQSVKFFSPNFFQVNYDPNQTTELEIISTNIFKEYPAKIIR